MKILLSALVLVTYLAATSAVVHAETQKPRRQATRVIRIQPAPTPHYVVPAAPAYRTVHPTPRAYAYGWFGPSPRRHWSRHHGYYRNYTEWSAR